MIEQFAIFENMTWQGSFLFFVIFVYPYTALAVIIGLIIALLVALYGGKKNMAKKLGVILVVILVVIILLTPALGFKIL